MKEETFSTLFFRFYDKKIGDGTITFSQLGMDKSEFTRLCTDAEFVPERKTVEKLCVAMKLTETECRLLMEAAGLPENDD